MTRGGLMEKQYILGKKLSHCVVFSCNSHRLSGGPFCDGFDLDTNATFSEICCSAAFFQGDVVT